MKGYIIICDHEKCSLYDKKSKKISIVDINNKYFKNYKYISVHLDVNNSGILNIPMFRLMSISLF